MRSFTELREHALRTNTPLCDLLTAEKNTTQRKKSRKSPKKITARNLILEAFEEISIDCRQYSIITVAELAEKKFEQHNILNSTAMPMVGYVAKTLHDTVKKSYRGRLSANYQCINDLLGADFIEASCKLIAGIPPKGYTNAFTLEKE